MFKSLVSAVKRLLPHNTSPSPTNSNDKADAISTQKSNSTRQAPPPLERDASLRAEAPAPAPPRQVEDDNTADFDDGVDDFLGDVIAGKTDKLRKEIAEQRLLSAAEEVSQNNNNTNNSIGGGQSMLSMNGGAAAAAAATGGVVGDGSLSRASGAVPVTSWSLSNNPSAQVGNGSAGLPNDSRLSQKSSPSYMSSAARSLQNYELIAYLGSGTFAEVTLARHRMTSELYAIKKISKQRVREEGCVERTFTERQLLASLRHPFLVQLYQAFQSRLYLYLVIDFAQGGDLYYFTEKKIWVKEMKRSLKKFKYPYYTNGGVQASMHKSQRAPALTMRVTDDVVVSPLEGSSSATHTHHHHHHHRSASWQGHESAAATDAALSDISQQDHLKGGGETDHDTRSGPRRALAVKKFRSANDLAMADRPAHRPRRHAKEATRGSPALFTPPSQTLASQSRVIESDAAGPQMKPIEAHDESDTDVPTSSMQALPASDPFSQETVERLRRQMHERQLKRQLAHREVADVGNGTDTDGNTDAIVSALAGVGASASTLNAVRAGEYYTTDAIDEFAGAKDLLSDAGAVSHETAKVLPPRVMPRDAGGEVANKAEEQAATRGDDDEDEDDQTKMLPQHFRLSEETLSPHNAKDDFVSSAASQRLAAQQKRRRDVERSRAQAHGGNAVDDDDDDDDDEVEEHVKRTPKEALSRQTSVPTVAVSPSARVPPSFRKRASRHSSATATASSSMLLDDGETTERGRDDVKPLATATATTSSSGQSSRSKSGTGNVSLSQKKMKRAAKSTSDLDTLNAEEGETLGHAEGYGTSTSSIGGRRGGARRRRGDTVVSSRSTRPKQARSSAVTIHEPHVGDSDEAALITSEIKLEQTAGAAASAASGDIISASDVANGDSPLPLKRGCTTPTANRSARHRGGAVSPSSAHGSHRAHHSRRSAQRSAVATPSQPLVASTPPTVHKVDLNAPFHESKTEESGVTLPHCAPDDSRLPLRLIAFYAVEVGLVLQYLHTSGFIYRDLKPENILMRRDGHIMLTDFGVAKHRKGAAVAGSGDTNANAANATNTNTSSGARATSFTGTAPYMSPEMVQGLPHDTRTDWWSFGCLLFEWCNGRKAYDEANQFALFRSIVEEDVKVTQDDFQLTALELHSRVAQLHYRHQEFILTSLHKQFASLPQESQSNVVAALADASFSLYNHATDEVARAALESSSPVGGGSTPPVLHIQSPNGHVLDPLGASREELAMLPHSQSVNSVSVPNAMNPSMSRIPKELLQSLAGTPTNLSFQFAPDGSISATVGVTNPFAGITGEHLGIAAYETFMRWAIEQEKEALTLLEDLIRALLNRNVQERLCGVDVLEHPFFQCTYVTSQLYYSHYVKMQYPQIALDEADGGDGATDAEGSGAAPGELNERASDTPPPPGATTTPSCTISRNSAGEPDLSPEAFLRLQPPVRRPDAWVDLFEERRIPPVYVPRLRTQDDLRYFPSAVTATGLSAAAEQQKRIKEAKGKKRELLRHAVEQAAQQSGAVMTEDENGVYLSLPAGTSAPDLSGTPLHNLGGSQGGSASGSMGPGSPQPALGSPADLLRRVSSSLSGGTLLAAAAPPPVADALLATAALPDSDTAAIAAAAVANTVAAAPPVDAEAGKTSSVMATKSSISQGVSFEDATGSGKTNETVLFSETAASSETKSASSMVESLTAHLAGLIADINSEDDEDEDGEDDDAMKKTDREDVGAITRDPTEGSVFSAAVSNSPTAPIPPEQLPASPQLVDVRLSASPLVAADDASRTVFSVLRTSASAGDEPHELCHTQPMMAVLPHVSLSSADESEGSDTGGRSSDGSDSPPSPDASHLRQKKASTLARVRQKPLVVPSIEAVPSTSPTFTLASPLPLGDDKETRDTHLHAAQKQQASFTSAPLVSLHDGSDSLRDSDLAHRRSAGADDQRASLVSSTGDRSDPLFRRSHPLQSFNEDEEAELSARGRSGNTSAAAAAAENSGWTTGGSTSTAASTPGFCSPDESGSATTDALTRTASRGHATGGSKEDEDEEVEDDFMARTAVLPSDFVKAALAVAAAKQQQQQQLVSVLPASEEKLSAAGAGAGLASLANPAMKARRSSQVSPPPFLSSAASSHMPANHATDGTHMMSPSAVMLTYPNIVHDLAEPASAAVGAGQGSAMPSAAAGAMTSNSLRRASMHPSTQANNYSPAIPGLSAPSSGGDVAAVLTEDPTVATHYLNVDTTGGYYETDALEEGDASGVEAGEDLLRAKEPEQAEHGEQEEEEEEDPDDALLTSITDLPGVVVRGGRAGVTRGPTSAPSSMLSRRQHTATFGSEPSLSLGDPSAATVSPSTATVRASLHSGGTTNTQPVVTVLPVETTRAMPLVTPTGALPQATTTTTTEITHDRPLMDSIEHISTLPAFSSADDVTMSVTTRTYTNANSRLSTPERTRPSSAEGHGESRPLFTNSADCSLTSSACVDSVHGRLAEGGLESVEDEKPMKSHTVVPSADGSAHTRVLNGTPSSMGDLTEAVSNDVAAGREEEEEENDEGDLSAPIDLLGYEEDEESGHGGVASGVDEDEETYTSGSFDDEEVEEGSQSAYSDEDNEGNHMDSYSGSDSSRTTTSSRASDREKAAELLAMHRTSSSSSSSSSSTGEAGFGTDQNLSFSIGRSIRPGSPASGGVRGMSMSMSGVGGVGNYSAISSNASNLGGASSGMRMQAAMAMSGSQRPWGGGGGGYRTDSVGEANPVSSLRSQQRHPDSARAVGGSTFPSGARSSGVSGAQSFGNASGTAGSYARVPYSAASGSMSAQPPQQQQQQQPWWRTSYSPTAHVSGSGGSGTNAGSFAHSGSVLSPTSSAQHGYPDFPLNALYAPVSTLSGISYDVEDDVHSPRHASSGQRYNTTSGGGGDATAAAQGNSAFRRFTQPFQNNASWTAGVHGRQSGASGATSQAASARPATLFTTNSRTTAAAAATAATDPLGAQQRMPEDNLSDGGGSASSGSGFMGYTFNGTHGGGPAVTAPGSRRSAGPVTPTSRSANVFSVTNVARVSPASGNMSDEQEGSSANLPNNPDHFANFSFFSAPSGLLPGGYGSNNNGNY